MLILCVWGTNEAPQVSSAVTLATGCARGARTADDAHEVHKRDGERNRCGAGEVDPEPGTGYRREHRVRHLSVYLPGMTDPGG